MSDKCIFRENKADIGRNHIAGGKPYHISGNDVFDGNFRLHAITQDVGLVGNHLRKLFRRRVGAFSLDKCDQAGDDYQKQDNAYRNVIRVLGVNDICKQCDNGDDKQHNIEGIDNRVYQTVKRGIALTGCNDIFSILLLKLLRLLCSQPRAGDGKMVKQVF